MYTKIPDRNTVMMLALMVAQVHSNRNLLLTELSRWNRLNRAGPRLAYSTAQD